MDNTKAKYQSIHWYLFAIALVALFFQSCSQARQASSETSIEQSKSSAPYFHSNFDLPPGDKLLWQESFATNNVGDFPQCRNTNAAVEIVQPNNGNHELFCKKDCSAPKQYNPNNKHVAKLKALPTEAASKEGFSTIDF